MSDPTPPKPQPASHAQQPGELSPEELVSPSQPLSIDLRSAPIDGGGPPAPELILEAPADAPPEEPLAEEEVPAATGIDLNLNETDLPSVPVAVPPPPPPPPAAAAPSPKPTQTPAQKPASPTALPNPPKPAQAPPQKAAAPAPTSPHAPAAGPKPVPRNPSAAPASPPAAPNPPQQRPSGQYARPQPTPVANTGPRANQPAQTRPAATAPKPAPAPPPPPPPAVPKPPPEWKVLEPDDPSDPTDHEVWEARPARDGWNVVAASVRGKLHAHKAQWREDSFKWGVADNWTIIAVSDGAGSSRLSRVASRIACETSVSHLQQLLSGYAVSPGGVGDPQPPDGDLQRLRSLLADAGGKARMAIMVEAQRRGAPIKDFSATLLVAALAAWQDRDLVVALQVGDGAIGMTTANGVRRLGISDHGEYSSETRFLTTPGIELEFHNRVLFALPTGLSSIAIMTDGVSDDFYPEDKRIGEVFDADPIDGLTAKGGGPVSGLLHGVAKDPRGGEALRDWLRYEKRGSSDDRTLVLMHRSPT